MLIYKILRAEEWAAFQSAGETHGAPVDLADGYIHFSTAQQLQGTLARHFAGETDLFILAVDSDAAAAALVWEPARNGALFPHLYRVLTISDVLWARPVEEGLPS